MLSFVSLAKAHTERPNFVSYHAFSTKHHATTLQPTNTGIRIMYQLWLQIPENLRLRCARLLVSSFLDRISLLDHNCAFRCNRTMASENARATFECIIRSKIDRFFD